MSDERETEVVAGQIVGVITKKADTWQVEVRPDGSQYTKKLWTKDAELKAAMEQKVGQAGVFVCAASYWDGPNGQVRSLWVQSVPDDEDATYEPAEAPAPRSTPAAAPSSEGVDWDAKERRDYRSRAWAQTLGAIKWGEEESTATFFRRAHGLQRMIYRDVVRELDPEAFPDDDVPF